MAANYVLLRTLVVPPAGASSITFDNIPQTGYTDLKVVCSTRDTNATANNGALFVQFGNGTIDTGANYTNRWLQGTGSGANSQLQASKTSLYFGGYGGMDTAGNTANTYSNVEIYIPNFTSSNQKSVSCDSVGEQNGTTAYANLEAGLWTGTGAITIIKITATTAYTQYSTFSLYGLAAVGTTPAIAPYASGGNIVNTDGTYWYHAFLNSGYFTPIKNLSCDVLVVAGGGGGGAGYYGGGGGAGGVAYQTGRSLTANISLITTIGAGGAGSAVTTNQGVNGNNSIFDTITAVGGGGGGSRNNVNGVSGGSGGGGAQLGSGSTGGSATQGSSGGATGYGFKGGDLNSTANTVSTGGGGAGGAGENKTSNGSAAGYGGNGLATWSSWGLATSTGQNVSGTVYYAGGGGGSTDNSPITGGLGGYGGGGAGVLNANGSPGTPNTGGGGGGAGAINNGGSAGSGIVIVRYAI